MSAPSPNLTGVSEPAFQFDITTSGTSANTGNGFVVTTSNADTAEQDNRVPWEGVLGLEGAPTSDRRMLIPGEIGQRDLPLPLNVQLQTAEGHDESVNAGRIEGIQHIPIAEFERIEEYGMNPDDMPENCSVIWGTGTFDQSPAAEEARRMIDNGAGVSLDIPRERIAAYDPTTLEEIPEEEMGIEMLLGGDHITGIGGKIAGATIVTIPAFESASIALVKDQPGMLVASASLVDEEEVWSFFSNFGIHDVRSQTLVADAGPLKPPPEWFQDPKLKELTPLTITKEGRVYGHLADWNGCHIGFTGICVPPFRSRSQYAYFNTGEIETSDGSCVPCGKLMFSRQDVGHAPTTESDYKKVQTYYDRASNVGAFVRAGSDRFGTWLAGSLRSDLNDLEVQHIRTHPPSGDWRPIKSGSELVAAFCVPVPGFPIRRALVASANGEVSAIISAPLQVGDGSRARYRRRVMLRQRLKEALNMEKTQAEMTIDRLRAKVADETEETDPLLKTIDDVLTEETVEEYAEPEAEEEKALTLVEPEELTLDDQLADTRKRAMIAALTDITERIQGGEPLTDSMLDVLRDLSRADR